MVTTVSPIRLLRLLQFWWDIKTVTCHNKRVGRCQTHGRERGCFICKGEEGTLGQQVTSAGPSQAGNEVRWKGRCGWSGDVSFHLSNCFWC